MLAHIGRMLRRLVAPISQDEDRARSEAITNVLLVGSLSLSFIALSINVIKWVIGRGVAVSVGGILFSVALFGGCYWLSRQGYARISSYFLLGTFFLFAVYMNYRWGIELPTALLTYVLVIVMSGILIGSWLAFVTTIVVGVMMTVFHIFERRGVIVVDHYWLHTPWEIGDIIVVVIIFGIIALVCWLSNREIKKSLLRARKSEAELKHERDVLEITVEERTREVKEVQAEKIAQLYRFAEFGRLSSGLFHDLMNPLNAIALNIENLKNSPQQNVPEDTTDDVDRAVRAAHKLQTLVTSVRKQLSRKEVLTTFCLNEEVVYVMDVLMHKARAANVNISFVGRRNVYVYGDAIKFNQVLLNLVANGIDAYADARDAASRQVVIVLDQINDRISFVVKDEGAGIAPDTLSKIFEPFFTTKAEGHGIGLSMSKRIIEKDFEGTLQVESAVNKGTVFTVTIPSKIVPT